MRFGIYDGRTHTLEEVGKTFGVTRERIRQIENKAIRKLRHPSRAKRIKDFICKIRAASTRWKRPFFGKLGKLLQKTGQALFLKQLLVGSKLILDQRVDGTHPQQLDGGFVICEQKPG